MPPLRDLSDKERIEQLEFQLAHQQRLIEQLNEVLVEHTQQAMTSERRLRELEEKLQQVEEFQKSSFAPGDERPPHW